MITILLKRTHIRTWGIIIRPHSSPSSTPPPTIVTKLFNGLIGNTRSDLARSITLVETSNPEKKKLSQMLLSLVLGNLREKRKNNLKPSLRIGY